MKKKFDPRSDKSRGPAAPARASIFGVIPVLEALRAGASRVDRIVIADGVRE
jgi:hypothetical protein